MVLDINNNRYTTPLLLSTDTSNNNKANINHTTTTNNNNNKHHHHHHNRIVEGQQYQQRNDNKYQQYRDRRCCHQGGFFQSITNYNRSIVINCSLLSIIKMVLVLFSSTVVISTSRIRFTPTVTLSILPFVQSYSLVTNNSKRTSSSSTTMGYYYRNYQQSSYRRIVFDTKSRRIISRTYSSTNENNEYSIENTGTGTSTAIPKKRILFLGTPDVAATTLQMLYEASLQSQQRQNDDTSVIPYEIVGVVTQPAKRRQRNKGIEVSPVETMAHQLQLPYIGTPESAKDDVDFVAYCATNVRPDLCITAAYGQYLPKRFLTIPSYGTVNIHPSLLPKWRGASPVQRAIENGDNPMGVSLLYTVAKMDAGPIIQQQQVTIDHTIDDTTTTLLPKLFTIGTNMLIDVLPKILDGTITIRTATPQDETAVTYAALIDPTEGELKVWDETATQCYNKIRAFSIWPTTYITIQVDNNVAEPIKVKVLQARVLDTAVAAATIIIEQLDDPTIIKVGPTKKDGLYVVCANNTILELLTVQPATKKAFSARDLQNGYPGKTLRYVVPTHEEDSSDAVTSEPTSSSTTTAPATTKR